MHPLPSKCPFCGGELAVTTISCQDCNTTIEGRFTGGAFSQLTREQLEFVETFVRCEGKINRMEDEIGLSYPTIRNRLHEIIRSLGYEPGREEASGPSEEERLYVLGELEKGSISYEKAMQILQEREA